MPIHPTSKRVRRHRRNRAVMPQYFNSPGSNPGPGAEQVHIVACWNDGGDTNSLVVRWSAHVALEWGDGLSFRNCNTEKVMNFANEATFVDANTIEFHFTEDIGENEVFVLINDHGEIYAPDGVMRDYDLIIQGLPPE